jgi:flagellar biosynthesis protein
VSDEPKKPVAVALRYDKPHAPRVIATGRGDIGQAIIDAARAHGIPLEQNPALAEALSTMPLEDEIPPELYRAMATVIAFILRASENLSHREREGPRAKRMGG